MAKRAFIQMPNQRVKRNRVFAVIVVSAFELALRVIEISASTTSFICALHFHSLPSQNRTKPADAMVHNAERFRFNAR
jgi:hypothetical protein